VLLLLLLPPIREMSWMMMLDSTAKLSLFELPGVPVPDYKIQSDSHSLVETSPTLTASLHANMQP
jgi:hypothetical protein